MTILVTGATGNVGRLVVDHLLARGATKVRALTNKPRKAALPADVEVVEGYLGKLETVPPALAGVDVLYLAPLPQTVREVVELAKAAGVRRIVDLSSSNADVEAAGDPSEWHYYAVEKAVEDSGLPWTHLRAGEFMTNMLDWAEQIRTTGAVRAAYPNAQNAPIALDDVAEVAAVCLLEEGHVGQKYDLTGPESLRRIDLVRIIGEVIGRKVEVVELTHEQAVAEIAEAAAAYPNAVEIAEWLVNGYAELTEHPQPVSPTFEALVGHPGTTFATWIARYADRFR
jgi:uncharacterized protein YbjT (DUF2867 family)